MKKQISVDPLVPTVLGFTILSFVGGIMFFASFLAPPPPDLRAEYCRGIADGDMGNYQNIQNNVLDLEARSNAAGFELLVAIGNPQTGQIMESRALTEYLPPRDEAMRQKIEDACNSFSTAEEFARFFARGPSNLAPSPTTTGGTTP